MENSQRLERAVSAQETCKYNRMSENKRNNISSCFYQAFFWSHGNKSDQDRRSVSKQNYVTFCITDSLNFQPNTLKYLKDTIYIL